MRLKANPDILRRERKKLTLTQSDMATLLSLKRGKRLSEPMYQKVEQGRRSIDIQTAKIISTLVGLPLAALFYFKDGQIKFGSQVTKPSKRF